MVIRSPETPSQTIYAVHCGMLCNQQAPSEIQSHSKLSKYTINSTAKANTQYT